MARRSNKGFNTPFAELKLAPKPVSPPPPKPNPRPAPSRADDTDDSAFARAMAGVRPLPDRPEPPPRTPPPLPEPHDDDLEALNELHALVTGDLPFDLADSDEYIEGRVQGLDARILRKLRRGEFAVQAHLDLHGYIKDAAKDKVATFLRASQLAGHRCVLIVHGRGLGSRDGEPVLKKQLPLWLTRGATGRRVLAFASARPHDGGAGAAYVLLRRGV